MAKQSNAFQKAIHYIHKSLENIDAQVIESGDVGDKCEQIEISREVDILIEKTINNKLFRIAIECRDRVKKDDILWIDSLIGKYQKIDVDKVIGVSSSGFTKNAEMKAKANQIELKTLEEVESTNWDEEFTKIAFCTFNIKYSLHDVFGLCTDGTKIRLKKTDKLIGLGEEESLLRDTIDEGIFNEMIKKAQKNLLGIYKTRADLDRSCLCEQQWDLQKIKVIRDDKHIDVKHIIIQIIGRVETEDQSITHYNYDKSLLSIGKFEDKKSNTMNKIILSQTRKSNMLHLAKDIKKNRK